MSTNAFLDYELVTRRVKVGNEWQTKVFPVVGGRLRIVHESNDHLSIETQIVKLESDFVVVRATVETTKGKFSGTGTASTQRDARLADALVELAETRAIARALRFGGIGSEYTSAEEVSHVVAEPELSTGGNESKVGKPVLEPQESENKQETKQPVHPKNGGNGNGGRATGAQCRALYALSKKAKMCDEDLDSLLRPLNSTRFEDLTLSDASRLIQYFQTQIAA
ncbi:MAG: hypothetical protein HY912_14685 [Desulfomonile tiedjei]|uniref:Uncharacterized protein n=1 Tax=Desulfomonile tiedjei TaxID=2358 RepID=A0A9D6V4M1_9BACT|nr:hypothetical protein [Desulfomonile tiedjei]